MIINILIIWNVLLTLIIIFLGIEHESKTARINSLDRQIKINSIYDTIIEEHAVHYHPSYYDDYSQRTVTIKEAIACLYRKMNFHLSYTSEKTETVNEDVSIK